MSAQPNEEQLKLARLQEALSVYAKRPTDWNTFEFLQSLNEFCAFEELDGWLDDVCFDLGVNRDGDAIDEDGCVIGEANFGAAYPDDPSYTRKCAGGAS
jgi:hypothetical protein